MNNHNGHDFNFDPRSIPDLGAIGANTPKGIVRSAINDFNDDTVEALVIWTTKQGQIMYKGNVPTDRANQIAHLVDAITMKAMLGS